MFRVLLPWQENYRVLFSQQLQGKPRVPSISWFRFLFDVKKTLSVEITLACKPTPWYEYLVSY